MKNFLSISKSNTFSSLCIGKFDGVHLAHQTIFSKLVQKNSLILVIFKGEERFSLTPNPQEFTSFPVYFLQFEVIKDMGDSEFASFLLSILPCLRKIVVGYDFLFGKNRAYTPKDLQKFFDVEIVPEVCLDGEPIHTRNIIYALKNGKIERANAMLGRTYSISGEVVRGQGLGSTELFPTLNLSVSGYILPQNGVYATLSEIKGRKYKSVSFLGHRLSTDGVFAVETHLIGELVQVPPKKLTIHFIHKLRNNQKFDTLSKLQLQIQEDIRNAYLFLNF